ncbi:MAG: hypothetical protein U1A78_26760 [Polyangia bacterium]
MPASPPAPSLWSARHLFAVLRAVARTSGLAAARRALPLYLGLLLGGSVIFGGNGMRAADVTTMAERSPLFRTVFVLLWLLATTPAVRALVFAREALLLRTLPIPAAQLVLGLALHLALLEAPLVGLWARGAGVGPALGLLGLCATGHALLVAGRRWIASLGPVLLGAALLAAPPRLLPSLLALPLLAWALVRGFRYAPERPPALERPLVFGPPLWALLTAHLVLLRRSHGAVLLRAAMLLLLGLAVAVLAVRNNQPRTASQAAALALLPLAPTVLLMAAALSGPVLLAERQLTFLLASTGCPGARRALAAALVPIGLCALAALGWAAALIGIEARLGAWAPARLLVEGPLCAAAAAAVGMQLTRARQRGEERHSADVPGPLAGLICAALLLGWALGELVLLGWALAGPVALARTISLAEQRRRDRPARRPPDATDESNRGSGWT